MSPAFIRAVNFVLSAKVEGGLSLDPNDRGNWTTGVVGKGELNGSKYGISAMMYPSLDIKSLSLEQAKSIYFRDYWLAHKCDRLPPKLGLCFFDAVVNMTPDAAAKCLQAAVGVEQDGIVGNVTLAAAAAVDQGDACVNFLAERALKYTTYKKFPDYGRGWFRRCMRAAMEVGR